MSGRTADDLGRVGDPSCRRLGAARVASSGSRVAWAMPGDASRRRLRVGRWRPARRGQARLRPLCGRRTSRGGRLPGTPSGHHRGGDQAARAPPVEKLRLDARVGGAGQANAELTVTRSVAPPGAGRSPERAHSARCRRRSAMLALLPSSPAGLSAPAGTSGDAGAVVPTAARARAGLASNSPRSTAGRRCSRTPS